MSGGIQDNHGGNEMAAPTLRRSNSVSQASENSQTAQDYISSQLQLEADAREALPYKFDTCTKTMGPLRQILFSCLTCNPPPESPSDPYEPAGVCYSCSISCHGEHTLVELFNKRNFECDCGTTRLPATAPCTLRSDENTGEKGKVTGGKPAASNRYNHNFRNRFCGCGEVYDAHQERGTMFQCLGLGSVEEGGCGEDWWHPECLVGLPRKWYEKAKPVKETTLEPNGVPKEEVTTNGVAQPEDLQAHTAMQADGSEEAPLPPGFPEEEEFEHLVCYKCVESQPWIKRYAGATGFLPPVPHNPQAVPNNSHQTGSSVQPSMEAATPSAAPELRKRKAEDDEMSVQTELKRQRSEPDATSLLSENINGVAHQAAQPTTACIYETLPTASADTISLFLTEDFRTHLCHCPAHFPLLTPYPFLLEEEETYSPPVSESSDAGGAPGSAGTKSLLDRGEAALSNMDRVRALEGVMAYNNLKAGLTDFLRPFAESGRAVGAEDIKGYFEQLRGDAEGIREAKAQVEEGGVEGDGRREQGGY